MYAWYFANLTTEPKKIADGRFIYITSTRSKDDGFYTCRVTVTQADITYMWNKTVNVKVLKGGSIDGPGDGDEIASGGKVSTTIAPTQRTANVIKGVAIGFGVVGFSIGALVAFLIFYLSKKKKELLTFGNYKT